jgi:hypothetical protein
MDLKSVREKMAKASRSKSIKRKMQKLVIITFPLY